MTTRLLLFCGLAGFAAAGQNQYMEPLLRSMQDGVRSAEYASDLALHAKELEEARRYHLVEEALEQEQIQASYRAAHADEAEWRLHQDMKDAADACKAMHDDCEKLGGLMVIIAGSLKPDWSRVSTREYVECLYVIAKHAWFADGARQKVLASTAP